MRATTQNDGPRTSAQLRAAERDTIRQHRGLKPVPGFTPDEPRTATTRADGMATGDELRAAETAAILRHRGVG